MAGDADALAKQLENRPELRAAVERERAQFIARIAELEQERDRLRASHERLRQELEVFKRRLFIAKAERIDTRQLEFEYAQRLRELDQLAGTLGIAKEPAADGDDTPASDGKSRGKRNGNRGTARRDLRSLPLEEERVEIADPHLEALVAEGTVVRHGFEETCKLAYKRGGKRRLVIARVRYKTVDAAGNTDVITTALPHQMLPGALAAPSLVANVIMENMARECRCSGSRTRALATVLPSTADPSRAGKKPSAIASERPSSRQCDVTPSTRRSA